MVKDKIQEKLDAFKYEKDSRLEYVFNLVESVYLMYVQRNKLINLREEEEDKTLEEEIENHNGMFDYITFATSEQFDLSDGKHLQLVKIIMQIDPHKICDYFKDHLKEFNNEKLSTFLDGMVHNLSEEEVKDYFGFIKMFIKDLKEENISLKNRIKENEDVLSEVLNEKTK